MTCSWGARRSCLELRESTMLSCWPTGPSITRLVRAAWRAVSDRGALREVPVSLSWWRLWITTPGHLLNQWSVTNTCQVCWAIPFCFYGTQIWRRSSHTSTPSGMERPHMVVEALVRNMCRLCGTRRTKIVCLFHWTRMTCMRITCCLWICSDWTVFQVWRGSACCTWVSTTSGWPPCSHVTRSAWRLEQL